MNAKFVAFLCGCGLLTLPALHAGESGAILDQLETKSGETFHSVEFLKSDGSGAYFRHSRGIVRVPYRNLSDQVRDKYVIEREQSGIGKEVDFAPAAPEKPAPSQPAPPTWIVVQNVAAPTFPCGSVYHNPPCALPYPQSLAIYPCRKRAELDFFYVTGIYRRPPGIRVHRLSGTRFF